MRIGQPPGAGEPPGRLDRDTVGIVGLGRFGTFLLPRLARDFTVVATDIRERAEAARAAGARWGTLDEVAACAWVITAVPIRALRQLLSEMGPRLAPGAVVVEVSSVKALPSRWLGELLPPGVQAVPTHPLFGPDSAARSIRGLTLVLCPLPGQAPPARRVAAYARSRGLRVVTMEPDTHDSLMASTQALTFFLSRVLGRVHLPAASGPLATRSYRRLRAALASVARDTDELYRDLVRFNPHAVRFLDGLTQAAMEERSSVLPPAPDRSAQD